jgi:hypothetical protein
VRNNDGVDWVPYKADGEAGIGRQVVVHDLNADKLADIIAGGMKGAHVLIHRRETVEEEAWRAAQPKPHEGSAAKTPRGDRSPIDEKTGRIPGALEGESLSVIHVSSGKAATQKMGGFSKDRWSGGEQLFWTGAKPGERLELGLPVAQGGEFDVALALTMARDYAIIRLHLDEKPLGEPFDLYNYPDVITTGVISLGRHELSPGNHKLTIEIDGANPSAIKAYMVGLDYVHLVPK